MSVAGREWCKDTMKQDWPRIVTTLEMRLVSIPFCLICTNFKLLIIKTDFLKKNLFLYIKNIFSNLVFSSEMDYYRN